MDDTKATIATFREKEKVAITGRVVATSATGDYCTVQILTKNGVMSVAVPVADIKSLRKEREWNFTCEGCGKHSDIGKGWVMDPEDAIWLCTRCKP